MIDFLSGRYREIERSLERAMRAASAEQRFEDAARERNRLRAVRSLLERQRVANESVGTLDAIAVAVARAARPTRRCSRSATACCRTARASTSTTRPGGGIAEVAEAFILQYYASAMMIPPLLIVQREVARTRRRPSPRR